MPDTFYGYEDWARERGLLPELPVPGLPRLPELAPYLVDEEPPNLQEPELLPTEPMSGWQRMAMVLSQLPEYQHQPYESGGIALGRGLLSGLARGFGGAGVAEMRRGEETRKMENQRRTRAAERANALALESWKYRRGTVERDVGGRPVRVPVGAVYSKETPQATTAKSEPSLERIEAEAEARARGARRGAPPLTPEARAGGLRWTAANLPAIRAAQSELTAARKALTAGGPQEDVEAAVERLDSLMKRDFAGQLKGAKTRAEADALADRALALYPEWAASPMIRRVAEDKRNEFGTRPAGRR